MVGILDGHFHQGQIMSEGAGFQCTAIAFKALLMAFTRTPDLQGWSSRNPRSLAVVKAAKSEK